MLLFGGIGLLYACALSLVISSTTESLENMGLLLSFLDEGGGGRYLAPALCAWLVSLGLLAANPALPGHEAEMSMAEP